VKLRWFSRQELKDEADSLLLPGKLSIARSIIEHWLGEELKGQNH
jgi:NAD+ diphosphatase